MKIDKEKIRSTSGGIIRISYRPISERISKLLILTSVTPNQITTMGIFFGLCGGFLLSLGEWKYLIFGVLFQQLAQISDYCDGEVARYRTGRNYTSFGKWYDGMAGIIVIFSLFFGATIGVYRMTNDIIIPFVGLVAIFNIIFIKTITGVKEFLPFAKGHKEMKIGKKGFFSLGSLVFLLLALSALTNQIKWCLWIIAILGIFGWIRLIKSHYKLAKEYDKNETKSHN